MIRVIALFILTTQIVFADDCNSRSSAERICKPETLEECQKYDNFGRGFCTNAIENKRNNEMQQAYEALLNKINRDKDQLVNAQEQWKEFIVAECSFQAAGAKTMNHAEQETAYKTKVCLTKEYEARTEHLLKMQHYVNCAGCPQ